MSKTVETGTREDLYSRLFEVTTNLECNNNFLSSNRTLIHVLLDPHQQTAPIHPLTDDDIEALNAALNHMIMLIEEQTNNIRQLNKIMREIKQGQHE